MPPDDEGPLLPTAGTPPTAPGYKWIRGLVDGKTIVDSRAYQFVWEVPYWPWWFFPRTDISADLSLIDGAGTVHDQAGKSEVYDVVCGGRVLPRAAHAYPDHPQLRELVAIDFDALDHWFEEDVEVFVHPRSPFTRVDALASSRHVVVSVDGVELAASTKPTVLFETGAPARFYLPMIDVHLDLLDENQRRAACPYKGESAFFDARVGDRTVADIAWTYVLPRPEVAPIAGLICFYNEKVDIDVDGERQHRPTSHFA